MEEHSEYQEIKAAQDNIIFEAEKHYYFVQENKKWSTVPCLCSICMAVERYHKAAMKKHEQDISF